MILEKRVMYDHKIDQRGYKWSGNSKLEKISDLDLPKYIRLNAENFKEWLD